MATIVETKEEFICDISELAGISSTGSWDCESWVIIELKDGRRVDNDYFFVEIKDNKLYGFKLCHT